MTQATKELLLNGAKPAPFLVPALDNAEVQLRPLSPTEAQKVQSAQSAGMKATQGIPASVGDEPVEVGRAKPRKSPAAAGGQNVEVDLGALVTGSIEAQILATHYGLVEPAMTMDEVRAIRPATIVEQIGREVMRRSGLGKGRAEQLRDFRGELGGSDDPGDPAGGDPAGTNAG